MKEGQGLLNSHLSLKYSIGTSLVSDCETLLMSLVGDAGLFY